MRAAVPHDGIWYDAVPDIYMAFVISSVATIPQPVEGGHICRTPLCMLMLTAKTLQGVRGSGKPEER